MGAGAAGDISPNIAVLPGDGIGPEVTGATLDYKGDSSADDGGGRGERSTPETPASLSRAFRAKQV
jgi:hypothetical protein